MRARRTLALRLTPLGAVAVALGLAGTGPVAQAAGPVAARVPSTTPAVPLGQCVSSLGAPNRWHQVSGPSQHGSYDVQQLSGDPCSLLARDAAGHRWRSTNAGSSWRPLSDSPVLSHVAAEGLQVRARSSWIGPVLGSGSGTGAPSDPPQVYVSSDGGASFQAARLTLPETLAVAAGGPAEPLTGTLVSAAGGLAWTQGVPHADVYAIVDGAVAAGQPAAGPLLLRSIDGGVSFSVVQPAGQNGSTTGPPAPAPSVVAVDPTEQGAVWVNSEPQSPAGAGAYVSHDGGGSFSIGCCTDDPTIVVNDIAIGAAPDGSPVVVLATNKGVRRSNDEGTQWRWLSRTPTLRVRLAPDNPSAVAVQTAARVEFSTGSGRAIRFRNLPGLPTSCQPTNLRRTSTVPPTFLVDCHGGRTYRLTLTSYGAKDSKRQGRKAQPLIPLLGSSVTPSGPGTLPMVELADWRLPQSDSSNGAVAFDGTRLYYVTSGGGIARVDARTGRFLGIFDTRETVNAMTLDLLHNDLLVSDTDGGLKAVDVDTRRLRLVGSAPYAAPSYDASVPGLSWVPGETPTIYLERRSIAGSTAGTLACSASSAAGNVSSYVAAGDGGGFVEMEDDATIERIDGHCRELGLYLHRAFGESGNESSDAMACDTQTFFPQPAIWIRDTTGVAAAFAVPSGYCPMPSRLVLSAPSVVLPGTPTTICATLTNTTNGIPGAQRPIALSVAGTVIGHQLTDDTGTACFPWTAPKRLARTTLEHALGTFSGDAALYPTSATTTIKVPVGVPAPPPPPRPLLKQAPILVVPPPPPPPPVPEVPPVPIAAPHAAAAPGQAPATNLGQVPQAQAQSLTATVVVPERQAQPQLALAQQTVDLDTGNAMVEARARTNRSLPFDPLPTAGLLALGCLVTAAGARSCARAVARAAPRKPPARRGTSPGYRP